MKYAVISDIHGNMQALDAVLEHIKSQNVNKILCLGDLAMAGPEPNKVIKKVKNQNWQIIQGNTDNMIANYSDILFNKLKQNAPIMANALKYDVSDIKQENIDFLKNLPVNFELNVEDVKILMVHGSPRKQDENIFPNLTDDEVTQMTSATDANLILCGHTHIPCGYQLKNKKTVVNVGSVGRPFTDKPLSCYAIINIENSEFEVEHHYVDYDKNKAAEILRLRNFTGSDKLAQMLINPVERHI